MKMKVVGLLFFLVISMGSLSYGAIPFEQVLQKARQGSVKEQVLAGDAYAKGKGVPRDYKMAFNWYLKAANQGYAGGQRPLGVLYELGRGIKKDAGKAAYWYEKAALQGVARAQVNLGILYEAGLGVPKDYQKAFSWYQKAADQGYGRGMNQLAMLYENGKGVKRDINQAISLYEKGASVKYSKAMLNLGRLYSEGGAGVSRDLGAAVAWYQRAVDLGFIDAEVELHRLQALAAEQSSIAVISKKVETNEKKRAAVKEPVVKSEIPLEKEEIQSEPLPSVKNETLSPAAPLEIAKPLAHLSAEKGKLSLLTPLFVGSVVTISTVFLLCLLYLKKRTKGLNGGSPLIAEFESDIKRMRSEIEQLSRVYKES